MHAKSNRFVGEVLYIYYLMDSVISLITTRLHREKPPVNGSKVSLLETSTVRKPQSKKIVTMYDRCASSVWSLVVILGIFSIYQHSTSTGY